MSKLHLLPKLTFLLLALLALPSLNLAQTPDANGIVYVKHNGAGNGSSWAAATSNLEGAINTSGAVQVWVAVGTYHVSSSSFVMKNNLAIYGGFDPSNGIDDLTDKRILPDAANSKGSILNGKNERPVIWNYGTSGSPITNTALLDGFTITGGAGGGSGIEGGGIYNYYASPTLTNLLIKGNTANRGAGIYNQNSSPVVKNVALVNNTANTDGGGIYHRSGDAVYTNVTIASNNAINGKALFIFNGTTQFNNAIVYGGVEGTPSAQYSLIEGNISTSNNNLNATGILLTHIVVNPEIGNYSLVSSSPAIDKGNDALFVGGSSDLAGNTRITGSKIDLGAYEFVAPEPDANGIVYVKTTGMGNGKSWANPTADLNGATNATGATKVFVEKGTYRVSARSFEMRNGVKIYGGFDPDNSITNLTHARILPKVSNSLGSILNGRNERPVVWNYYARNAEMDTSAVLDGFTLTEGAGGGMYNQYASPSLYNLVVKNNQAGYGGGMYNDHASPLIQNTVFFENTGTFGGGAMYNFDFCNPKMINCLFYANTGNLFGGGAISNNRNCSPALFNCTLTGNVSGNRGGAMNSLSYCTPIFANCIIYGNTAVNGEDGITYDYTWTGTWPFIYHSLIQGTTSNDINGNVRFEGNINEIFSNPSTGDFTLKAGGPAINRGYNSYTNEAGVFTDLAGNTRIQGNRIDLGVYEAEPCSITSTLYVNETIIYSGNGASWTAAYKTLTEALDMAKQCPNVTEIRVAAGTYYPTGEYFGGNGNSAFIITRSNLKIVGGYNASTGQRDVAANKTTLTGDINSPDDKNDNSYHVVVLAGIPATDSLIIDGFTISEANATGTDFPIVNGEYTYDDSGGGMFISSAGSNTVIRNCTFEDNYAAYSGGGVFTTSFFGKFESCIFKNNTAELSGGGMYNSSCELVVSNSIFDSNISSSGDGGGVFNDGASSDMTNCIFTNNTAFLNGGAFTNSYSPSKLNYCTFKANTASGNGGAVHNKESTLTVTNTAIIDNTAGNRGGNFYNDYGKPELTNNTIANSTGTSAFHIENGEPQIKNTIIYGGITKRDNSLIYKAWYSLIEGASATTNGNVDATGITIEQIFTNPSGGDYTLLRTSKALNGGRNALFQGLDETTKDLAGNPRLYATSIDMGVYELHYIIPDANGIVYVKTTATGNGSGRGWTNATNNLQGGIDAVGTQQVWVAKGTYYTPGKSFVMKNNVAIYGGFDPDNGIDDLTSERILPNPDNLEGSVLDGKKVGTVIWNEFSTNNRLDNSAVLDGFTITNGGRNPYVATGMAGGISNEYASPTLSNLVIKNNLGTTGGGISISNASPVLTNIVLQNNTALSGGGIYTINSSKPVLKNVTIRNNVATYDGGGVYNVSSPSTFTNVAITGNTATHYGGGFYSYHPDLTLSNITLANNTVGSTPNAFHIKGGTIRLQNSIIYGGFITETYGAYTAHYSLIEGNSLTSDGNLDATGITPGAVFVNPSGEDYTLLPCSPATNAGNPDTTGLYLPLVDLVGLPRVFGDRIDMGAFENNTDAQNDGIATINKVIVRLQTDNGTTNYLDECNVPVASVTTTGDANDIQGASTAKVWIATTQPDKYVKRHYEITPSQNAEHATGRVTIYFTQEEFDDFNFANTIKLPTGPGDNSGIGHILIEKIGGSSSDGSGLPATYTGTTTTITNPDVIWNSTANRWEISFAVTGFSGFFVKTTEAALPVRWISFGGRLNDQQQAVLTWKVDESAVLRYQVERSFYKTNFQKIAILPSKGNGPNTYQLTETSPLSGTAYYRIRMVDRDGTNSYSKIISLDGPNGEQLKAYPNPVKNLLTVHPGKEYIGQKLTLTSSAGIQLQQLTLQDEIATFDMSNYASGLYLIYTHDGKIIKVIKE